MEVDSENTESDSAPDELLYLQSTDQVQFVFEPEFHSTTAANAIIAGSSGAENVVPPTPTLIEVDPAVPIITENTSEKLVEDGGAFFTGMSEIFGRLETSLPAENDDPNYNNVDELQRDVEQLKNRHIDVQV